MFSRADHPRDSAGGVAASGVRAAGGQRLTLRGAEDHPGVGQDHQGGLPAAERLDPVGLVLPHAQDHRHDAHHRRDLGGHPKLIAQSSTSENALSFNEISMFCKNELDRMGRMKELDPLTDESTTKEFFDKLSKNFKFKLTELEEKI
eukprot:CAMPEP_0116910106 /NCGR_PEP_ID=MMETSP0467-20121206/14677_2 /TAXON_ID=283647 /ORGANISM="Mesodinium pulex, Strain SPMC105" /LENGTH=146 /DNA_ID=CAMNT_0004585599 /DNA_START=1409 /DNA_END=1851 /DNA_ORIENTATION=-